jgi:sulfur carrier protein
MMYLTVNGLVHRFEVLPTLLQLLQELGVEGRRVAVECNGDIVPRSQYGHVMLNSGDCLEIVVAVGGG